MPPGYTRRLAWNLLLITITPEYYLRDDDRPPPPTTTAEMDAHYNLAEYSTRL